MKIVLDTNVLISSMLTPTGLSYDVVSRALKKHLVILSDYILSEFHHRLVEKFKWPEEAIEEATRFFKRGTIIVNPDVNAKIMFDDPKDVPILQLIQFTKANYLITGDKKVLALKTFEGTLIFSPREALEFL